MSPRHWTKRLLSAAGVLILAGYAGVLTYFVRAEPSLVFASERSHTMRPLALEPGQSAGAVSLESLDGTRLSGAVVNDDSGGNRWIYFLHGNGANVSTRKAIFPAFRKAGANVFLLDYRGFGESGGTPSEQGIYDDAEAGYRWLLSQGAPASRIVIYGYSLGSAVAIQLASRVPAAGLIVEGALSSIPALGQERYPFLPVGILSHSRFDSLSRIASVRCPKLFLHGDSDTTVPIRHGRELYAAALEPKQFVQLKGTHSNALILDRDKASEAIRQFLDRVAPLGETAADRP